MPHPTSGSRCGRQTCGACVRACLLARMLCGGEGQSSRRGWGALGATGWGAAMAVVARLVLWLWHGLWWPEAEPGHATASLRVLQGLPPRHGVEGLACRRLCSQLAADGCGGGESVSTLAPACPHAPTLGTGWPAPPLTPPPPPLVPRPSRLSAALGGRVGSGGLLQGPLCVAPPQQWRCCGRGGGGGEVVRGGGHTVRQLPHTRLHHTPAVTCQAGP